MNPNCVEAITAYADRVFGRKLTAADLRNMDDNINYHRKKLAGEYNDAGEAISGPAFEMELAKRVGEQLQHDAIETARRAQMNVVSLAKAKTMLEAYVAKGKAGHEFLRDSLLTRYDTTTGRVQSVEAAAKVIEQQAYYHLQDLNNLEEGVLSSLFGNKEGQHLVIKEMYGVDTGSAEAKAGAAAMKKAMDMMHKKQRAAGADVGYLENYFPQLQDMDAVRSAGREKWVADAMERIDTDTIRNFDGTRVSPDKLKAWLDEAWYTIAYDGMTKQRDSVKGGWSLATRNRHHRQLHWKDADSYIQMMEQYGAGSLIEQVAHSISSRARDIVMMEKFGPNALHNFEQLKQQAIQMDKAAGRFDTDKSIDSKYQNLDNAVAALTGIGKNEGTWRNTQKVVDELQGFTIGSLLGSLPFAQLADNGLVAANNIATGVANSQWFAYKAMAYVSPAERQKIAAMTGAIFDPQMRSTARFTDNASAVGIGSKIGNILTKVTGANWLTRNHRTTYRDFQHLVLSEHISKYEFDGLEPGLKTRMEAAGFTKTDWDILKASQKDIDTGAVVVDNIHDMTTADVAKFIPERMAEIKADFANSKAKDPSILQKKMDEAALQAKDEAISKMLGFSMNEAEIAILQPSLSTQLILQPERGSLTGIVGQMFKALKTFPIAFVNQFMFQRMKGDTGYKTAKNMMSMLAFTSVMGGISLLLGDMAKGRDPRQIWNTDDPKVALKFMVQSIMRGGGLGIFGDLALMDKEGRNVVGNFIAGPLPNRIFNIAALGQAAALEGLGVKDTNLGKKAAAVVTEWNPLASNMYTRALNQKYFTDAIKYAADPDYYQRQQKNLETQGQGSFIGIGPEGESRAPNFENVIR